MSTVISRPTEQELQSGLLITQVCVSCDKNVFVSPHFKRFHEIHGGPKLAWYGIRNGAPELKGISDPTNGDFECLACHSKEWLKLVREARG